jgi:hypothetical protein
METYRTIKKWLRILAVLVCVFLIGTAVYSLITEHFPYQTTYNQTTTIFEPILFIVGTLFLAFLLWPD